MAVELSKPALTQYVNAQVAAGRFPSAEAAIEAAVEQMMLTDEWTTLTDDDAAAINEAEAQIDRGECEDFHVVAARLRERFKGV